MFNKGLTKYGLLLKTMRRATEKRKENVVVKDAPLRNQT